MTLTWDDMNHQILPRLTRALIALNSIRLSRVSRWKFWEKPRNPIDALEHAALLLALTAHDMWMLIPQSIGDSPSERMRDLEEDKRPLSVAKWELMNAASAFWFDTHLAEKRIEDALGALVNSRIINLEGIKYQEKLQYEMLFSTVKILWNETVRMNKEKSDAE